MEPGNEAALNFYRRLGFEAFGAAKLRVRYSSRVYRACPRRLQVGEEEVYKERRAVRLTREL